MLGSLSGRIASLFHILQHFYLFFVYPSSMSWQIAQNGTRQVLGVIVLAQVFLVLTAKTPPATFACCHISKQQQSVRIIAQLRFQYLVHHHFAHSSRTLSGYSQKLSTRASKASTCAPVSDNGIDFTASYSTKNGHVTIDHILVPTSDTSYL